MLKQNKRLVVFTLAMLALLIASTFLPASAQLSQWRSLNPTRDGRLTLPAPYLYGVHMLTPNYGWAVGGNCDIYDVNLQQVDWPSEWPSRCSGFALSWDGSRWRQALLPASSGTLTSVFIVSQNDVWAVGTRNETDQIPTILHWDGIGWSKVQTPVGTLQMVRDLLGVFMLPGGTDGWVVGTANTDVGTPTNVLRWSGIYPTGAYSGYLSALGTASPYDVLRSVNLLSPTHGWIVGSQTTGDTTRNPSIYRWDGAGWLSAAIDAALTPPPPSGKLLSVYPVSTSDAWAVGENSTIIRWNGASWTGPMVAPTTAAIDYRSIHMVSATDGLIAGTLNPTTDEGIVLRWNGVAWSILRSYVTVDLNHVSLLPGGLEGVSVGDAETIIGWNGSVWFAQTSPTERSLNAVSMVASNDGWAVGNDGTIFRYNGASWSHYETLPSRVNLYGLHMRTSSDGWAVGAASPPVTTPSGGFPPTILRWDGAAWSSITPSGVALKQTLYDVDMLSSTESWAVGNGTDTASAAMLKWDGSIWVSVPSGTPTSASLFGIDMLSSTDGWAVGCTDATGIPTPPCQLPTIIRWNGLAWSTVTPPPGIRGLTDVFMLSPTDGWAVGYTPTTGGEGTIIHWNGAQWTRIPGPIMGTGGFLKSVHMMSPTDGWAVGYYGHGTFPDGYGSRSLIVHWDGLTWNVVSTLPLPPTMAIPLRSVFMVAALDGWIVSDEGLILKYGPEAVPGTTTSTSTIIETSTATSTVTSSTTTSTTTSPLGQWGIPGFPIESILAGLLGGLIALTVIRRKRRL